MRKPLNGERVKTALQAAVEKAENAAIEASTKSMTPLKTPSSADHPNDEAECCQLR